MTPSAVHLDLPPSALAREAPRHRANCSRTIKAWRSRPVPLLILYGFLLGAMIVTWASWLLSRHYDRAIADKERELRNLASVIAEHLDRAFQAVSLIETNLIEDMRARAIDSPGAVQREMSGHYVHLMLKDKISGLPYVGSLSIIDAQGNLINSSASSPVQRADGSGRDDFDAIKSDPSGGTHMSGLFRTDENGNSSIHVMRPFSGPAKNFIGLVLGTLELRYFEQYFGTIALGEGSIIALTRRDGTLLARYPHSGGTIGQPFGPYMLFREMLANSHSGVARGPTSSDGRERLIAGHRLTSYPAVVSVGVGIDSVLAEWRRAAGYLTGAALLMVAVIGGVIFLSARQVEKQLSEHNIHLDAALNNMSQGLVMFDARGRLVVCNRRYLEMYRLSSEAVQPGCPIREILKQRAAAGTFAGDAEEYVRDLHSKLAAGGTVDAVVHLPDGRIVSVVHRPMPNGGWVATDEDITDRRRREESFRLLFDDNPVPMWVYDLESLRILAVNDTAVGHYGYSRETFLTMTVLDVRPDAERELFLKSVRMANGIYRGESIWRHLKADGTPIEVAIYSRALSYESQPAVLVAIIDITDRRKAERERALAKKFLNMVIDNIPVSVFVKDARTQRYVLVNRAALDFLELSRAEVIGKTVHDIIPSPSAEMIQRHDQHLLETTDLISHDVHEITTAKKRLHLVTAKRVAIASENGEPQYLLAVIEDVTERALTEARIAHMAHHDPLTDLPNRTLLHQQLEAALQRVRRGAKLAVLYLDLDHFKNINDTLGHTVGDELLKAVAARLREFVEKTDMIARLGGDEFAIVRGSLHEPADAALLAQRVRGIFDEPFDLSGHEVVVDASIGVAVAPDDGTDLHELLKKADLALYGAKGDGRGTYRFFEAEMDARMKARLTLQTDLRKAFAKSEFEVHYQPIVDLQTNQINGFEALLRWNHPERGMIPPAEFIPLAEEMGLIVQLGEWVIRRACADAATWPKECRVAINISPVQFKAPNIVPVIVNAMAGANLPACRLELEITEIVLLQNNEKTVAVLHQLRALGVRIAMDDFGTGYSSLSYLRSFPFDKIKIDRSFVGDLPARKDCRAIVRAITELAGTLDMTTTAEGVETEQQFEIAKALGCTEMQGYLFGGARPADRIAALFSRADRRVA